MGTQPSPNGAQPQFSAHVYLGQTAGSIKMPLSTEVGLARPRRHCVRWGPSPPGKKGTAHPELFGRCLLWPNSCMDQDAIWYGGRPRPRLHCVKWGPSSPTERGTAAPSFWPVSIVAKWSPISATAELLFISPVPVFETEILRHCSPCY